MKKLYLFILSVVFVSCTWNNNPEYHIDGNGQVGTGCNTSIYEYQHIILKMSDLVTYPCTWGNWGPDMPALKFDCETKGYYGERAFVTDSGLIVPPNVSYISMTILNTDKKWRFLDVSPYCHGKTNNFTVNVHKYTDASKREVFCMYFTTVDTIRIDYIDYNFYRVRQ